MNICRYYHSWLEPLSNEELDALPTLDQIGEFEEEFSDLYEKYSEISETASNISDYTRSLALCESGKVSHKKAQQLVLFIKMELCVSTLAAYLLKRKTIKYEESLNIFTQLLAAVNYLHQEKVIHRDIKVHDCVTLPMFFF